MIRFQHKKSWASFYGFRDSAVSYEHIFVYIVPQLRTKLEGQEYKRGDDMYFEVEAQFFMDHTVYELWVYPSIKKHSICYLLVCTYN